MKTYSLVSACVALATTLASAPSFAQGAPPVAKPAEAALPQLPTEATPLPAANGASVAAQPSQSTSATPTSPPSYAAPVVAQGTEQGAALVADESVPSGSLQRFFLLRGSLRFEWPSSAGFHPFNRKEIMPSLSLDGSQTIFVKNRWSLALGGQLDVGGASSNLRGVSSGLGVRKLSVTGEARYHLHPRWYVHGKLAPGVAWASASLQDSSSPQTLTGDGAVFALEGTLGASFLVTETRAPEKRPIRLWLSAEGGYVVSSTHTWALTTGENTARESPTNLGDFSLNAPMMRLALAGSY